MTRLLLLAALALLAFPAYAANCICTGVGCKIAVDPYPLPASSQPTSCRVENNSGTVITGSSCSIVPSSSIATSNTAVCQPGDSAYVPGPSTNVTPLAVIPSQPLGPVTLVIRVFNAASPGGVPGSPFTFTSVASLSTPPSTPTGPRVVP